jgi:hypothetical protein
MLSFSSHGSSHNSDSEELNWLITWKTRYDKWEPGPKSRRGTCDEMIRQYKDTDGQKKKTKK